jgi:hypothetical protein
MPWAKLVKVDLQSIRLTDPENNLRYLFLTPGIPQAALVTWDEGVKPQPFSFQLGPAGADRHELLQGQGSEDEAGPLQPQAEESSTAKNTAVA